VTGQMWFIEY